ncbi:MBL fold metallo-hydrolase [Silanimonas lenta]|uniref:MBL fold metallo-hydrolase n=1 Tax=Silanimonas lenta TaxID=265429 RepID=UPI00040B3373|nr:MBL fold metallo-hydrolase [Silanimonas lenta]
MPHDPVFDPPRGPRPQVSAFFDEDSHTLSYVVREPEGPACAILDPVLDFDYASGRTSHRSAEAIARHVEAEGLRVEWIIETHVHADHLTAAPWLKTRLGGKIAIGEHIGLVQATFGRIFNEGPEFATDGSQFDHLFRDGERYRIGALEALALHTPGHTPACMTHVIGDAAFVGDTLFMPDAGSARADFPGGDARTLFRSMRRVLSLPPETRLFMCHDYAPGGREIRWETTVAEQRASNIHVRDGMDEEGFVRLREARDATLSMPRLIVPSLQVNMKAGALPPPETNGVRYLKVPLDRL